MATLDAGDLNCSTDAMPVKLYVYHKYKKKYFILVKCLDERFFMSLLYPMAKTTSTKIIHK